jgi:hypothetical protein
MEKGRELARVAASRSVLVGRARADCESSVGAQAAKPLSQFFPEVVRPWSPPDEVRDPLGRLARRACVLARDRIDDARDLRLHVHQHGLSRLRGDHNPGRNGHAALGEITKARALGP